MTCDRGLSGRLESKSMLLKKQMCAPDFPKSMILISVIIPAAENSQVQQYWYKYTRSLVLIATSGLVGTLLVVYLKPYYTMPARVYIVMYTASVPATTPCLVPGNQHNGVCMEPYASHYKYQSFSSTWHSSTLRVQQQCNSRKNRAQMYYTAVVVLVDCEAGPLVLLLAAAVLVSYHTYRCLTRRLAPLAQEGKTE